MNTEAIATRLAKLYLMLEAETALQAILTDAVKIDGHLLRKFNKTYPRFEASVSGKEYCTLEVEHNGKNVVSIGYFSKTPYMNNLMNNLQRKIDSSKQMIAKIEKQCLMLDNLQLADDVAKAALIDIFTTIAQAKSKIAELLDNVQLADIDHTIRASMQSFTALHGVNGELEEYYDLFCVRHKISAEYQYGNRQRVICHELVCLPEDSAEAIERAIAQLKSDYNGMFSNFLVDGENYNENA